MREETHESCVSRETARLDQVSDQESAEQQVTTAALGGKDEAGGSRPRLHQEPKGLDARFHHHGANRAGENLRSNSLFDYLIRTIVRVLMLRAASRMSCAAAAAVVGWRLHHRTVHYRASRYCSYQQQNRNPDDEHAQHLTQVYAYFAPRLYNILPPSTVYST